MNFSFDVEAALKTQLTAEIGKVGRGRSDFGVLPSSDI